jgi:hypothetical protein
MMAALCALFALLVSALLVRPAIASAADQPCDRACLNGLVDDYLEAVVAHDASRLAVTPLAKFTENGQQLGLGDGFWRTATARGRYKLYADDPQAGEVGYFGTMREAGAPVLLALRLKVENRKISQIETIVIRGAMAQRGVESLEKTGAPNRVFLEDIPAAERASRLDLIATANKYFSGMQLNDGKGNYSFFADDCNRLEDGLQTTNNFAPPPAPAASDSAASSNATPMRYSSSWSCKQQFQSGLLHFVTRIRDRRFMVVDQQHGIVLTFVFFDHAAGNTRTFQLPDGRTVTSGPKTPWTWEIAVMMKIEKGKIRQIEGELTQAPYGMGSGWSSWEDSMSDAAQW